jgi:hypothetical protein
MGYIRSDLVEAYVGVREDEYREAYEQYLAEQLERHPNDPVESYDSFARGCAVTAILEHLPRHRLETYLQWNGIIGYDSAIFDIATGNI